MASPPPFFGEEDLDLSGLDEDMLLHLLDDDGEMLLPPPPPPQEPYAPPPAPIVQPQPNNATSSAPLAPLPLAASTQPALLQPRPAAAALAPRPAVHPVPIAPSIKPRGPLVLPKGYTATGTATVAATSAPPPIAPRPLATAGVKRKASSSSSSSSSSVSAASSVASGPSGGMDEKEAVAMEVERAVAALEEQVCVHVYVCGLCMCTSDVRVACGLVMGPATHRPTHPPNPPHLLSTRAWTPRS